MLLDILIPTIPARSRYLLNLLECLAPQLTRADIGLLILSDDGTLEIGEKRNRLLEMARADYVCFIDDDDLVSPNYVSALSGALQSSPDCVGFKMRRFYDQIEIGEGINSIKCGSYRNEGHTFYRTPGHLNPIRRELAVQIGFEPISRHEDMIFAERIFPLLKTEVFIDEHLYEYWYRSPRKRQEEEPYVFGGAPVPLNEILHPSAEGSTSLIKME